MPLSHASGTRPVRLWRSVGDHRRSGAEGPLFRPGPAPQRRDASSRPTPRRPPRRRRVLVVTTCSPRPMRAVQRASVVGDHLHRQPGGVGGEAARGEMVEPHAVLEVPDGILDLGVAAMVGLQFEGVPVAVGDEAVIAVVGEEQGYARPRPVQRRLTGESARGCMLMVRRVVRTKTDWRLVRIARRRAWSGSHATASLVTPRPGRSRWGEWQTIRGSLRRHAYTALVEAMMSRGQSDAKPAELSQLNLNAAGHRRGGHRPLRGGTRRPGGAAGTGV